MNKLKVMLFTLVVMLTPQFAIAACGVPMSTIVSSFEDIDHYVKASCKMSYRHMRMNQCLDSQFDSYVKSLNEICTYNLDADKLIDVSGTYNRKGDMIAFDMNEFYMNTMMAVMTDAAVRF